MLLSSQRLHLAVYDRKGKPGFHYALILAPKHNGGEYIVYDIANTIMPDGTNPWRFRERGFDTHKNPDKPLVATLLLAKIPRWSQRAVVARLRSLPVTRPAEVPERDWSCIAWVKFALDDLRAKYPTIPPWDELKSIANAFGQEKTREFLNGEEFSFGTRTQDVRKQ